MGLVVYTTGVGYQDAGLTDNPLPIKTATTSLPQQLDPWINHKSPFKEAEKCWRAAPPPTGKKPATAGNTLTVADNSTAVPDPVLYVTPACPGKRTATSIILMEQPPDGTEIPRVTSTFRCPPRTGDICQNITLNCIRFICRRLWMPGQDQLYL